MRTGTTTRFAYFTCWDEWGRHNRHSSKKEDEGQAINIADLCYYIAFALYSFFHLFESTNYQSFLGIETGAASTVATALMLALLVPRFATLRFSGASLLKIMILLLVGLVVYIASGSWIFLSLVLFICAGYGIGLRVLMHILLWNALLVFASAFLGSRFGIIETILSSRHMETVVRDSCGFAQVNFVGAVAVRICAAIVALRWGKPPRLTVAFCIAIVLFVEFVANSRTAEVCIIIMVALNVLYHSRAQKDGSIHVNPQRAIALCMAAILVSAGASLALMLFFDPGNSVMMQISELLSNRLYSAWYLSGIYGVSAFGNGMGNLSERLAEVLWTGSSYASATVDNAWAAWAISYGLVPTLLAIAGFAILFKSLYTKRLMNGYVLVLTVLTAFYAFCESSALSFDMNPVLALLSIPIFEETGTRLFSVRTVDLAETNALKNGRVPVEREPRATIASVCWKRGEGKW